MKIFLRYYFISVVTIYIFMSCNDLDELSDTDRSDNFINANSGKFIYSEDFDEFVIKNQAQSLENTDYQTLDFYLNNLSSFKIIENKIYSVFLQYKKEDASSYNIAYTNHFGYVSVIIDYSSKYKYHWGLKVFSSNGGGSTTLYTKDRDFNPDIENEIEKFINTNYRTAAFTNSDIDNAIPTKYKTRNISNLINKTIYFGINKKLNLHPLLNLKEYEATLYLSTGFNSYQKVFSEKVPTNSTGLLEVSIDLSKFDTYSYYWEVSYTSKTGRELKYNSRLYFLR